MESAVSTDRNDMLVVYLQTHIFNHFLICLLFKLSGGSSPRNPTFYPAQISLLIKMFINFSRNMASNVIQIALVARSSL